MQIGKSMDPSESYYAWQLTANHLADEIRNIWLENSRKGLIRWDEQFSEEPDPLAGMREEGFRNLVGLDYIFCWDRSDAMDEFPGELSVIWKIGTDLEDKPIRCYKTWVKLQEQDFTLPLLKDEPHKREKTREGFRNAFSQWREMYLSILKEA
ncbi:MAG: hypothetical protein LUC89_05595 [Oscillospiraceae bacterium]|nr:hypothetical protein [Oscillospiraceae bacterium]